MKCDIYLCIATYLDYVLLFGSPFTYMYIGGTDDAEGIDYVYQNYRVSFKNGEETKSLITHIIDDNIVEPDETYELTIDTITTGFSFRTPSSRVIKGENATTTITIVDDDGK